jgi:hypothetical protein
LALTLAAYEAGEDEARALQLLIEYDPEPPFYSGSLEKADAETQRRATDLMAGATELVVGVPDIPKRGTEMTPTQNSENLAGRAGRWSGSHMLRFWRFLVDRPLVRPSSTRSLR